MEMHYKGKMKNAFISINTDKLLIIAPLRNASGSAFGSHVTNWKVSVTFPKVDVTTNHYNETEKKL